MRCRNICSTATDCFYSATDGEANALYNNCTDVDRFNSDMQFRSNNNNNNNNNTSKIPDR